MGSNGKAVCLRLHSKSGLIGGEQLQSQAKGCHSVKCTHLQSQCILCRVKSLVQTSHKGTHKTSISAHEHSGLGVASAAALKHCTTQPSLVGCRTVCTCP